MFRYSLVFLVALWTAGPAAASSWAEAMFDRLTIDFGSVPRGPTLSHHFRITNSSPTYVHIAGVRVSCGCVTASALRNDLLPGQTTAILAQMDTHRFVGFKSVTVYVQFDQPSWAEVRLVVQANARDDMTLSPEGLVFGQVKHGTVPAASLNINFWGNSGWAVTGLSADSNYVQPLLKEVRRDENGVGYQLSARLRRDTPIGKWYTDIWLRTNNEFTPRVRVPLTVEVEPALSATPSPVLFQARTGESLERRVIIRGPQPFRITGFRGTDGQLSIRENAQDSKSTHILSVIVKADKIGEWEKTIQVLTDLKEEGELEIQTRAQITP